ncbi:P-loop containing nucleoside triphosphate hydrolase protein [Microstroma glucosiphilum]|uniref:P-loop containing nucleoside triphosphate hydrolase protein n=1 Tax=Pseudomicrostroma glucosiphilum TaxID=1684307 RepID=A0A316UAT2_9BASI|nr:P-loop containing nucleoside triphosphate hydrolase protein [Pseudomicrostroma glucosiphilum]PWN21944.1 P-loop containing nucleoside triphosphate hydrolase protein [Pseudomicrostroma glucosiphilum]
MRRYPPIEVNGGLCRVVAPVFGAPQARWKRAFPTAAEARIPLQRFAFSTSSRSYSAVSSQRPALFKLKNAIIPGLKGQSNGIGRSDTLDLSIEDRAGEEAWAVTGPAADRGGAVKAEVVKTLLGLSRPKQPGQSPGSTTRHPSPHPFLQGDTYMPASQALRLVSFSSRLSSAYASSSASNSFVDFSTRYGAIREEDRVTLYESLMAEMGTQTGLMARMALMPDPLANPEEEAQRDYAEGVTRLKWSGPEEEQQARELARQNHAKITEMAPLLQLSQGDPPLLIRPVVALSNGQTRRARILAALCVGCQVLVLEEPFTGLDPPTRASLTELLSGLHSRRSPRVICVLREQDELPDFVTDVLSIGEEGQVVFKGSLPTDPRPRTAAELSQQASGKQAEQKGGYELCLSQSSQGVGRGDESQVPIVEMKEVCIAYKGKPILDRVSLRLPPGSRTILVGDNGSGKTTLLSLLLGMHPQSYSLGADQLTLFGQARAEPVNATPLLRKRCGQLSPELVNAFPRRGLEYGGLSVQDSIGSGFEGIFSRRELTPEQVSRVRSLVRRFQHVLVLPPNSASFSSRSNAEQDALSTLLALPLHALTPGSQVLVLFLRAIVHRPDLLVLDEPFQGMSSKQVTAVRDFLDGDVDLDRGREDGADQSRGEQEEREQDRAWLEKMALVLVSHFEEEWPRTAGRLIRLREGSVVESF